MSSLRNNRRTQRRSSDSHDRRLAATIVKEFVTATLDQSRNRNHKRKLNHRNDATNQPDSTQARNKKPYSGPHPRCDTCNFHHPSQSPCRFCSNCNRFGHLTNKCHTPPKTASSTDAKVEPKPTPPNNPDHYTKHNPNKKRKPNHQNYAINQTGPSQAQHNPNTSSKRPYTGPYPLCHTCNRHHPAQIACRICTTCHLYGHLASVCRNSNRVPYPQTGAPSVHACFNCGDPGHLRNACPQLAQVRQIQTFPTPPPYHTLSNYQVQTCQTYILQVSQAYQTYVNHTLPMLPIQAQPVQAIPFQAPATNQAQVDQVPQGVQGPMIPANRF